MVHTKDKLVNQVLPREQILFSFQILGVHGNKTLWVVCSTPHALSPDTLSPDTLSPRALSPCTPSPDGLSENVLSSKKLLEQVWFP